MEDKKKRMRELVELLNRARRAYEQENTEIMSNYEYDQLYDELQGLEQELRLLLPALPLMWDMRCSASCRRSGMNVPCCRWTRPRTWNG